MHRSSVLSGGLLLSMAMLSGCMHNPSTESTTPTASVTTNQPAADKPKQAIAKPTITPVGVKTIKPEPTLKAKHKLSPQEVEDLIRKLSVCRPS